jgi:hypothetical protein
LSAPAVAGAAGLVQQYLQQKYPAMQMRLGSADQEGVISSHLLRAFLIQSADWLNSQSEFPDSKSGFGVPNLNNVIVLDDDFQTPSINESGIRFSSAEIESDNHHVYAIRLGRELKRDLRATLTWSDPPTSELVTFADLDLVIEEPDGSLHFANGGAEESYSTAEKIVLPITNLSTGEYRIHVHANSFPLPLVVQYSLVVNGPFPQYSAETFTYIEGPSITCDELHTGTHCQIGVVELVENRTFTTRVQPRNSFFFVLRMPEAPSNYIVINSTRDTTGIAFSRFVINQIPSKKMTSPRMLTGTQSGNDELLFINRKEFGGSLYIAVFDDFIRPGSHSFAWFRTDAAPDKFQWFWSSATPQLSPGIIVTLIAALLVAVGLFAAAVRLIRQNLAKRGLVQIELPLTDNPDGPLFADGD